MDCGDSKVVAHLGSARAVRQLCPWLCIRNLCRNHLRRMVGKGPASYSHVNANGNQVASGLREMGFVVTQLRGLGRKKVYMIYLPGNKMRKYTKIVKDITSEDMDIFYVIDNVKLSSESGSVITLPPAGRAIFKKK